MLKNNLSNIKLIDFEFVAISCEEFDLANTFNECILDNSHPTYPFIKNYFENCLTLAEVKGMITLYLGLKYDNVLEDKSVSKEDYIESQMDTFLWNFFRCTILINVYWGIWSIGVIKEKNINEEIFNFGFADCRMDLNDFIMNHPEFSKLI